MIIDIVDKVYKVGSNRGITCIEKPNLLRNLNSIIEWEFCKFPSKFEKGDDGKMVDMGPNLEYLGTPPELKPGNVFLYRGQLISIDTEEKLVLSISETGFKSLQRVFKDEILPEINMKYNDYLTEIEWEAVSEETIPEHYKTFGTNYNLHKIWRDRFGTGRNIFSPDTGEICIKVMVDAESSHIPMVIYMLPWSIKYDTKIFGDGPETEKYMGVIMFEVFSWFYEEYKRLKIE